MESETGEYPGSTGIPVRIETNLKDSTNKYGNLNGIELLNKKKIPFFRGRAPYLSYPRGYDSHMNQRNRPDSGSSVFSRSCFGLSGLPARRSSDSLGDLPGNGVGGIKIGADSFSKELLELCTEIAGALLRGYADGKAGRVVRRLIVTGLAEKMQCPRLQAHSLVDLSLELIHLEAYGRFKRNPLEFSLLVAQSGGEVRDIPQN